MTLEHRVEFVEPIQVSVSNLQANLPIDPAWVQASVVKLLESQQLMPCELSVVIVDDAAIRGINARHLTHDWPTDVVSFAFGAPGDEDFGGELVISAETAVREAKLREIPSLDEFALYLVHGLLHVFGFDDRTEVDAQLMRRREEEWLGKLGIDNPFRSLQSGSETIV